MRQNRIPPFPPAILLAAVIVLSCSPPPTKSPYPINHILALYGRPNVPGAAVAVLQGDSIIFQATYGNAQNETGSPVSSQTNFRLASVTKQFTATAVLLLLREEHFSFNTTLTELFNDFPAYGSRITIRHLLTHTSGLIDYESLIPDSQTVQVRDQDVLVLMRSVDSTSFPPGTEFRYSNSAYAVLSQIVELKSGMSFADFLRERIFHPTEMTNTIAFVEGISAVRERAFGHTRSGDGWKLADQSVTSAVLGDGGIYSSIEDLTQWCRVLSRSPLPGDSLQKEAFLPQVRINDSLAYGYGWYVRTDRPLVYHTGSTRGFRTAIIRFPDQDLSIILLTNRNEGDVFSYAMTISRLFVK